MHFAFGRPARERVRVKIGASADIGRLLIARQRQALLDRRMLVYVAVVAQALLGIQPAISFISEAEFIEGLTQQSVDTLASSIVYHQARCIASQLRQGAIEYAQATNHGPLVSSWPQAGYRTGGTGGFMGVPLPLRVAPRPGGYRPAKDTPLGRCEKPAQMSQHARVVPAQQRPTAVRGVDGQLSGQVQNQPACIGLRLQQQGKNGWSLT